MFFFVSMNDNISCSSDYSISKISIFFCIIYNTAVTLSIHFIVTYFPIVYYCFLLSFSPLQFYNIIYIT